MTKQMQQNLIAIFFFLGCMIFLQMKYLMGPLNKKYHDKTQQLEQVQTKIETLKRRAMDLPRLQREMSILKNELSELEKTLPKEVGTNELLKTITKTAQTYKIDVLNFSPAGMTPQANYNEINYKLNVNASYHSLAQFFTDIGQESRIIGIKDLSLNYLPSSASDKGNTRTIAASFTLVAFTTK
jgi:Tfp pilus assembly protein PilO